MIGVVEESMIRLDAAVLKLAQLHSSAHPIGQ
jgi:hypothetical protein